MAKLRSCIKGEDRDPSEENNKVSVMKKPKLKKKNRSDPAELSKETPSSRTSTPSDTPSKKPSKRSVKRVHSVWSTMKTFVPHQLKNRHKNELSSNDRLGSSHPDVSSRNLETLTKAPVEDSGTRSSEVNLLNDTSSLSDPNLNRQDFIANTNYHGEKKALMNTTREDQTDSGVESMESTILKQRQKTLRNHAFFQVDVHLRSGKDLLAKDSCGTSDPYVKFKLGGRQLYKSRTIPKTLNPYWDEFFSLPVEDVFQPLYVHVYDYDFGLQDDYMGSAQVDLTFLDLNKPTDVILPLTDSGLPDDPKQWGSITLTLTLIPKTQVDKEQYFNKSLKVTGDATLKKQKMQLWDSVMTIVLVEGKNLLPMDENGFSDPYVKFRLGNEKYRSKVAIKTLNPKWMEQFDLHMYSDQSKMLEITVWDKDYHNKDDIMGRCTVDLNTLEKETTHRIWRNLEDGAGSIFFLLTISGMQGTETTSDLPASIVDANEKGKLLARYGILHSLRSLKDIGHLIVKVFKAQGLAAADIGGKSDPFCVVELVNSRLQTHTEYKTLTPEWNKIFIFQVKDIHSVLEVTVYDEDRDKRCEFLGKVAIPLLKIKNGEKRWYALKDKKLRGRAKGQILLELDIVYNRVKASIRTFNPKEIKYIQPEQKFKRLIFMRNVNRVKTMALDFVEVAKFLNSCFQWESAPRSIAAFIAFLIITYTVELYMVPIVLLLVFLKNYIIITVTGLSFLNRDEEEDFEDDEEEEEDDSKDTKGEEKKSLKEKLQAVQEVTAMVQNILGEIASMGERAKNTFNFSVPFLSWLAIFVLTVGTVVLYYVPIRYIFIAWGINKFTKKLRNPHAIPNNELLDFLSRVPDNNEKIMYKDIRPNVSLMTEVDKRKTKKTS
ncbi:multiple C2 and transmembrane domain-containing protein 1-like [Tachypleus tridentatus]|uniref:multiple C2 and transmembrane domain-containing protein 1-like n=1 Tax=Tachypleus tridentatus TaxID=6853 RepID=UPI003FD53D25